MNEYPNEVGFYVFQNCLEKANGISTAERGRWGRSLRRTNTRTSAKKTYGSANEMGDKEPQKHKQHHWEYAVDMLKYIER